MEKTVTRELLRKNRACYDDSRIDALVPVDGLTAIETARLGIPVEDRIWVLTLPAVCPPTVLWEWQALLVERALARVEKPDPRSLAVVPLLRRLAVGEDVPQEERDAARAAARDAAWAAARAAARDAAWAAAMAAAWAAARDAARAAAWDAALAAARDVARDAEEGQQIVDLVRLLTEYAAREGGK